MFDDWFAMVATNADALPDFNTTRWARLFGDSRYQFPFDENDDNDATEEARMDSQVTDAINEMSKHQPQYNGTVHYPPWDIYRTTSSTTNLPDQTTA